MPLMFEWDSEKAKLNEQKHGVSFREAATIFGDVFAITIHDPEHSSAAEERFITLGESERRRLLVIIHADREDRIRIISARRATPRERTAYEERR